LESGVPALTYKSLRPKVRGKEEDKRLDRLCVEEVEGSKKGGVTFNWDGGKRKSFYIAFHLTGGGEDVVTCSPEGGLVESPTSHGRAKRNSAASRRDFRRLGNRPP